VQTLNVASRAVTVVMRDLNGGAAIGKPVILPGIPMVTDQESPAGMLFVPSDHNGIAFFDPIHESTERFDPRDLGVKDAVSMGWFSRSGKFGLLDAQAEGDDPTFIPVSLSPFKPIADPIFDVPASSANRCAGHRELAAVPLRDGVLVIDFDKQAKRTRLAQGERVTGVAFLDEDRFLAAAGASGRVVVWDLDRGQPVNRELRQSQGQTLYSAPGGLASVGNDGSIKYLPFPGGNRLVASFGITTGEHFEYFHSWVNERASASYQYKDGSVVRCDLAKGICKASVDSAARIYPMGGDRRLLAVDRFHDRYWLLDAETLSTVDGPRPGAAVASPRSERLAVSDGRKVSIVDSQTHAVLCTSHDVGKPAKMVWQADESEVLFLSNVGTVRWIDGRTCAAGKEYDLGIRLPSSVVFSPDARFVGVVGADGAGALFRTDDLSAPVGRYSGERGGRSFVFDRSGHRLLISAHGEPIQCMDLTTGRIVGVPQETDGTPMALQFDVTGARFAVQYSNRDRGFYTLIYDSVSALPVGDRIVPSRRSGPAIGIHFLPGDDDLLIASSYGLVERWHVPIDRRPPDAIEEEVVRLTGERMDGEGLVEAAEVSRPPEFPTAGK